MHSTSTRLLDDSSLGSLRPLSGDEMVMPTFIERKVMVLPDADITHGKNGKKFFYKALAKSLDGDTGRTVGVNILNINTAHESKSVKISLWDTDSHEKYHDLLPMFTRGALGYVFIFKLSDANCLKNFKRMHKEISAKGEANLLFFIGFVSEPASNLRVSFSEVVKAIQERGPNCIIIHPFVEASKSTFNNPKGFLNEVGKHLWQRTADLEPLVRADMIVRTPTAPASTGRSVLYTALQSLWYWSTAPRPATSHPAASVASAVATIATPAPALGYRDFVRDSKTAIEINPILASDLVKASLCPYFITKKESARPFELTTAANRDVTLNKVFMDIDRARIKINGESLSELLMAYANRDPVVVGYSSPVTEYDLSHLQGYITELSVKNDRLKRALEIFNQLIIYEASKFIEVTTLIGNCTPVVDIDSVSINVTADCITAQCSIKILGLKRSDDKFYELNGMLTSEARFVPGSDSSKDSWVVDSYSMKSSPDQVKRLFEFMMGKRDHKYLSTETPDPLNVRWNIVKHIADTMTRFMETHPDSNFPLFSASIMGEKMGKLSKFYLETFKPGLAKEPVLSLLKEYIFKLFANPLVDPVDRINLSKILTARQEFLGNELDSVGFGRSTPMGSDLQLITIEYETTLARRIESLDHLRLRVMASDDRSRSYVEQCIQASASSDPSGYMNVLSIARTSGIRPVARPAVAFAAEAFPAAARPAVAAEALPA